MPATRRPSSRTILALLLALPTTAQAVDGVIEINQVKAAAGGVTPSDAPGFPVTIDTAGSYRLTGDLTIVAGQTGIEISASAVSVDLNGFHLACLPKFSCVGAGKGILSTTSESEVTIRNGSVLYMGSVGIWLPGQRARVDHVRVYSAVQDPAMRLGSYCQITHSDGSGGIGGIIVGDDCLVSHTTGGTTNDAGLTGGSRTTVTDSTFSVNAVEGVWLGSYASVVNVTTTDNGADGILVGSGSTVIASRAAGNGRDGIAGGVATVVDSVAIGNGTFDIGSGIHIAGGSIKGSVAKDNSGDGIEISSGSATVVATTATGNAGFGLNDAGSGTSGYANCVFNDNNEGNENPQVSGGLETDGNVCGDDLDCP